jgi:hypothetical protein
MQLFLQKKKVIDFSFYEKKRFVLEHRKQFENHRKKHYNEFEIVRLRKQEIEAELRALEQEETVTTGT